MEKNKTTAKVDKTVVTEENMGDIFNEKIYPSLLETKGITNLGEVITSLLKDYVFEDELMKVRFMVPVFEALSKAVLDEVGLNFNEMSQELKQQIGWNFVNTWMLNGVFVPLKLINYGDLLNANANDVNLTNLYSMDDETKNWLKEEANFIIEETKKGSFGASDEQLEHLEKIKEGQFPYGFK